MEAISKRKKLIPFLICMFFALFTLVLTNANNRLGLQPYYLLSAKDLNILRIGAILFSLFSLITPWYFERFSLPLVRKNLVPGRISHETRLLLASYAALYFPVISGELLYRFFGLPIAQVNYFMGAGILGMVVWCVYTLSKNAIQQKIVI